MFRSRYYNTRKIIFVPYNKFYPFKKPFVEPTAKYQYVKVNVVIFAVATIS